MQEILLWFTGILMTLLSISFGAVVYLAKQKIDDQADELKEMKTSLGNTVNNLKDLKMDLSIYREKSLGIMNTLNDRFKFIKVQTDKIPDIKIKLESVGVLVESHSKQIENFGEIIIKDSWEKRNKKN